jgi:hypothetical protein
VIGGAEHGRAWVTTDPCESAEIIVARAAARITRRLDLSREQEEAFERFMGSLLDALVRGPIARINLVVEPARQAAAGEIGEKRPSSPRSSRAYTRRTGTMPSDSPTSRAPVT